MHDGIQLWELNVVLSEHVSLQQCGLVASANHLYVSLEVGMIECVPWSLFPLSTPSGPRDLTAE